MTRAPSITTEHLDFGFEGRPVLRGVNLSVPAGRCLGVLGRSGSGKSTLLQLLMGLLTEQGGVIRFGDRVVSSEDRRGRGGYVPQKPSLLPWRTVLGNLLVPAAVRGWPKTEAAQLALSLLDRFDLKSAAGLWPYQLSGGMAQRIAVLRAAMFSPDLLFLDEPFSALDALTRLEFQSWLAEVQAETRPTTILVTHDVREALTLCHQVVVLAGTPGRVSLALDNIPSLGQSEQPDAELEQVLLGALLPGVIR